MEIIVTCLLDSLRFFFFEKNNTAPVHYRKPYYKNRRILNAFFLSKLHTDYF